MNWNGHQPVGRPGQDWDDTVYCRLCGTSLGLFQPITTCPRSNAMNTLPPPPQPNLSATTVSTWKGWAHVATMRPGDGFTIELEPDSVDSDTPAWIRMTFTDVDPAREYSGEVVVSIHRRGIPALIAELQRLMS